MTEFMYQVTLAKRDAAVSQALSFLRAGDTNMFGFWASAARAYEARALDDTVSVRLQAEVLYAVEPRRQA